MQVMYKVASVEEYADTSQRMLTLTLVTPTDLIGSPEADEDPEWDAAFDRVDEALGDGDIRFKANRSNVGLYGGVEATTENPNIKPGMYLRFTAEIVSEEALDEAAGVN